MPCPMNLFSSRELRVPRDATLAHVAPIAEYSTPAMDAESATSPSTLVSCSPCSTPAFIIEDATDAASAAP